MTETASSVLAPWSNFYITTGSSAAALTGLMFVVITLVNREEHFQTSDGIDTFSTPTVLHFCAALLVSVIVSAPWRSLTAPAALLSLAGIVGMVYALRVFLRARRLERYTPDLEDWLSYTVLPFAGYILMAGGGIMLRALPAESMFSIASGVVLLLFVGIHNAWDVVTFIVIKGPDGPPATNEDKPD